MAWLLILILFPYLYLLLKIYTGLLKIRSYNPTLEPDIFVSVIIACRNEEKRIPRLLDDIASQEYNADLYELIIVDDNSDDNTYESARSYKKIKNIKVLKNNGTGKKKAVSTGIEASSASFIITTDADCRVGNMWLKTIASFYDEKKPELVISPVILDNKKGFFNIFQELEFLSLQGVTAGTAANGNPVMCNGANMAFLKKSYVQHSVNLHDEFISGDDVFLLHNIKRESGNIAWLESVNAQVTTEPAPSISSFLRQRARWISKAGSYQDRYTKILAIVTFVTILFQLTMLFSGFISSFFLEIFLAVFILKSIPDFLIINNISGNYKRKNLMWFFLPAQFLYPFYVMAILIFYFFTRPYYMQSGNK